MSGRKIDLPSGGWLELRPMEDVTERQRRRASNLFGRLSPEIKAFLGSNTPKILESGQPDLAQGIGMVMSATEADMETFDLINDAIAVALIASWSYPDPPTVEMLPDIKSADYRAVQAAVAPYVSAFMGLDTSPNPDPDSPI